MGSGVNEIKKIKRFNESNESDLLSSDISKSINQIDDSMSYKDFADAVVTVLKDDYGKHNFQPFIEELKNKLAE